MPWISETIVLFKQKQGNVVPVCIKICSFYRPDLHTLMSMHFCSFLVKHVYDDLYSTFVGLAQLTYQSKHNDHRL